ncbi:hypothetical protein IFR05_006419 [Cadophora sp. M221]|nr:hypothetical protein IFR05_006419 [Cadophora sp. M221]
MAAFLPPGIESMFPSCSLNCVATALDSQPAISQNLKLLCADPPIEKALADCVRGSCSFPDQQKVGAKNNDLCKDQPVDNKVAMSTSILGLLGAITNIIVGLRLYTRVRLARGIGYDDYLIIAASTVLSYVQISGTVESDEISYQIVITCTKCSILCFYLRLFPGNRFRAACFGMLAVTLATGLGFLLITIFQCKPIRGVFDKSISSSCLDVNALTYASGAMSIAIDFTILLMPIPQLLALRIPKRQRNSLLFLFSFGLIASVISIFRLPFIVQYGKTTDPLFDNIGPGIWTISEMASAIIAACLPTLRPLAAKIFPNYFSDTYSISNQEQAASPVHQPPQFQQIPRGRQRGNLSQEFNYLFSHTSDHSWMSDEESIGMQSSTQESKGTQDTQRSDGTIDSQREYFDLQDGQIVWLDNRFSALSIGFVSEI